MRHTSATPAEDVWKATKLNHAFKTLCDTMIKTLYNNIFKTVYVITAGSWGKERLYYSHCRPGPQEKATTFGDAGPHHGFVIQQFGGNP